MQPRAWIALVLLPTSGSCGSPAAPSTPTTVVGDWMGQVAPLHTAYLSIRFTQQSSGVTGVACYQDAEIAGNGNTGIRFSNVPVTIAYPRITVQAPDGFRFEGTFTSDGTISGSSGTNNYPMSILRGGNYCGLSLGDAARPR